MQDPYLEGSSHFYSLFEFFPSVEWESTEYSVPQRGPEETMLSLHKDTFKSVKT